jgi:hypothetical protein
MAASTSTPAETPAIINLKPAEIVERILISSTSRFIAEYVSDGLIITHAWPGFGNPAASLRMNPGPLSRSAFMLSFVVPEVPKLAGVVIPNYEVAGERICALLSLLYGKRFDSHGPVQSHGQFVLPHLDQFNSLCIGELPQNNHTPRSDIAIPLDLRAIRKLTPILTEQIADSGKATALYGASKFYHQALQNAEIDPEVAYLHLITAGEILSNAHRQESDEYLEEEIRNILEEVRQVLPNGERAARMLASRMRQIKRRFRLTLDDFVDERFFGATNNLPPFKRLKLEDFSRRLSAAYDVRSRYVHTGCSFGEWVAPWRDREAEIPFGRPRLGDAELADLLEAAPTYIGLERVIRYALFRFAECNKLFIDEPLLCSETDNPGKAAE